MNPSLLHISFTLKFHSSLNSQSRQNQFSLEIDFVGELAQYTSNDSDEPLYVLQQTSAGSSFVPVESMFFYVSF